MKKTLKIELVENLIEELDLTRSCRLNDYLYPRSILYYNIRKYEGWSFQRIADLLKVNHATV